MINFYLCINPKVHGKERRKLKKRACEIANFLESFWHDHQMEKDMTAIYGGGTDTYPMSDEKAQEVYDKHKIELEAINLELSIPYNSES